MQDVGPHLLAVEQDRIMKNEVSQQIVNKLIELGRRDNLDEPSIAADFEQFRPYEHLGRIHWREWNSVCEGLSIEEHISLLKAVVMAMRYSGWDGGSVAPGIWVFKKLEERIPNKQVAEIAKWVIEHSDNPWMPFGNQRDRVLFIANQDIDNSEDSFGTMLLKLKFIESAERTRREQTQDELQKQQQAAKVKRLAMRKEESKAHLIRKNDQERIRMEVIAVGEPLDTVSRLRLIIQHQNIPLHSFPSTWANVPKEDLKGLDKKMRKALIERMSWHQKGPWKVLRDCLDSLV